MGVVVGQAGPRDVFFEPEPAPSDGAQLVIFFYELLFMLMVIAAMVLGEVWSRLAAVVFLGAWFVIVVLGSASFGARLAVTDGLSEEDRRWFTDARDGLRHLRLLFGLATLAALAWRLIAG